MDDTDRYKLHHGPYVPPKCRVGDKLPCEYRGRELVIRGMTDAPIQWPCARRAPRASPILCGDLIRAVRCESEVAVAYHWGVNVATVWAWRRALNVPRTNEGTRRLFVAYTPERLTPDVRAMAREAMGSPEVRDKIRASKVGKPLHPNMIAAQREAARRPRSAEWKRAQSERMKEVWGRPEEHGLPPCHRWTDEEIALLGREHDSAVAERLGVPKYTVENKRRRLGIPGIVKRWTDEEVALLGTKTDREIASQLGRETAAVRRKREIMGIPPFVARWTDEEITLLGTDTDGNIAKRLGRTRLAAMTKRMSLGIPGHGRR
jgi:hypothetical protein